MTTALQLAPPLTASEYPIPATMTWTFAWARAYTIVKALAVHDVPKNGYVEVTCRGRGCAFFHRRARPHVSDSTCRRACKKTSQHSHQNEVNLTALFKAHSLKVGTNILVNVLGPGWIGKSFAFAVRKNRPPLVVIACLANHGEDLVGEC